MKKNIYVLLVSLLGIGACSRDTEVIVPDFDVTIESSEYKVDEEVTFNFSGNASQISFYSGEKLHDYQYSTESRKSKTHSVKASFRTNVTYNNQPNQFAVFLSTDYNGGGTYADIQNATWRNNISQQFNIAPENNPWGSNFPSGTVDLVNAFEEGKPLYIGFRYKNTPGTGIPRNWYAYSMNVDASTLLATNNLFSSFTGFSLIYDSNFTSDGMKNSVNYNSYVMFRLPVELRPVEAEVWAVSPPIYLEEIDHGPDRPKAVKGYRDPMPQKYSYSFSEPGTYTCTFLAYNSSVYGQEEVVKQVKIKVTE